MDVPQVKVAGTKRKWERQLRELVVSSSKTLVEKSREQIIDLAMAELREFFPGARDAKLVKSTVIKEVHATYSPQPGVDAFRPHAETVWPRVFLAGDWTATGWPATMEGGSPQRVHGGGSRGASGRDTGCVVPCAKPSCVRTHAAIG